MNILRSFHILNGKNTESFAKRIQGGKDSVKTFCIECPILLLVLESLILVSRLMKTSRKTIYAYEKFPDHWCMSLVCNPINLEIWTFAKCLWENIFQVLWEQRHYKFKTKLPFWNKKKNPPFSNIKNCPFQTGKNF